MFDEYNGNMKLFNKNRIIKFAKILIAAVNLHEI